MRSVARFGLPAYAMALTLAVAGPLLRPGYLLIRDAVSTPRSYLTDAALGLTESAPRALPQDVAVAALTSVVDGGVVVTAVLIAGLFLAGWGAARLASLLLPDSGWPGQLVATTAAVWNPYVAERLLQGHWSLLLGYGTLPWVAVTVIRLRTGPARPADWAGVAFWIALAGLTPTGLLLAAVVALVCVAVPGAGSSRGRSAAWIVVVSALAAAPWLLAPALSNSLHGFSSGSSELTPFAARAEPALGTLGSLAGLGGIWNADAVPASRTTAFALVATIVLLAVVACGVVPALRNPRAEPLLMLAGAAIVIPAALATGPGQKVLQRAVEMAPGLGVLRDGQKWVALAMPGYALAGAGAVITLGALARWLSPAIVGLLCALAILAALPDLTWGLWGKLAPGHYPPGWAAVAATVNADPSTVAVLPADIMRQFDWAGPAPVLDPLPRWVRAEVLSTGDLAVAGRSVRGEGSTARAVQQLLLDGADPSQLSQAGVGWLVVEHGTPGTIGSARQTLQRLPVAYQDADISLYRIGGVSSPAPQGKRTAMILAHLLWAAVLVGGAVTLGVTRLRQSSG